MPFSTLHTTDRGMSWKNLRGNIPNKSYFSNVDCLDGEFVRSSLLKAYFGVPSLTQLYLFCHAFVAKQLDKYISFCSISKNLTHFKTKLVGDDCNKTQQNFMVWVLFSQKEPAILANTFWALWSVEHFKPPTQPIKRKL